MACLTPFLKGSGSRDPGAHSRVWFPDGQCEGERLVRNPHARGASDIGANRTAHPGSLVVTTSRRRFFRSASRYSFTNGNEIFIPKIRLSHIDMFVYPLNIIDSIPNRTVFSVY